MLTPTALGSPVSLANTAPCAAPERPEGLLFVVCNAWRRPLVSFLASWAVVTALLMALPTAPDRARVMPLCLLSVVCCWDRLFFRGSYRDIRPLQADVFSGDHFAAMNS